MCEEKDGAQIRHVRFATLEASGQVEDRLELQTTTDGGPTRITEYLVNGTVVFIQEGDGLQPTSAGRQLLRASRGDRPAKLLAAFAAAHSRLFVADVEAPHHSCGALSGKAEETAKCSAIGVAGCSSGNAFVCAVSAGVAVLCVYLVDKVCEENPDSCQPGWTEG